MKVLFDTNVILDVLFDREPFSDPASRLLSLVEQREISGMICATTITTIYYLSSKALGKNKARHHMKNLITLFEIAAVNGRVIEEALKTGFSDFEDSVIYHAAHNAGAEALVTRDPKGFKKSKLPVFNPAELLRLLTMIE